MERDTGLIGARRCRWTAGLAVFAVLVAACASTTEPAISNSETSGATPSTEIATTTLQPSRQRPEIAEPSIVETTTTLATRPPRTASETAFTPQPVPLLGPDVWLVADYELPDVVVRVDRSGEIREELWVEQITESIDRFRAGHTLVCQVIDEGGPVEALDLFFEFTGPLQDTLQMRRVRNGEVVFESIEPVDGSDVPDEINQTCGAWRAGIIRVTAMQLGALLAEAGFTDIAGDHAIDPVWEAAGTWIGVRYPINLFQGDFRPDKRSDRVVLECRMGGLDLPLELPTDARDRLEMLAGCFGDQVDVGIDLVLTRGDALNLPLPHFEMGYDDRIVYLAADGTGLGHLPTPAPPVDPWEFGDTDHTGFRAPDHCELGGVLGSDQARIYCTDPARKTSPTVEILFRDGTRTVVGELPSPPEGTDALFIGHFESVLAKPGVRGIALAQLRIECELSVAAFIEDGYVRQLDGNGWWDSDFLEGQIKALGWVAGRAVVFRSSDGCGEAIEPEIVAYDVDGSSEVLKAVDNEPNWIILYTE